MITPNAKEVQKFITQFENDFKSGVEDVKKFGELNDYSVNDICYYLRELDEMKMFDEKKVLFDSLKYTLQGLLLTLKEYN